MSEVELLHYSLSTTLALRRELFELREAVQSITGDGKFLQKRPFPGRLIKIQRV
jgi:hypothetical protein